MKKHVTYKPTRAQLGGDTFDVPAGTELVLVTNCGDIRPCLKHGADGYAVKHPTRLGACPHDAVYRYAYVCASVVFSVRLVRPAGSGKEWPACANEWEVSFGGQVFSYFTGKAVQGVPSYDDVMYALTCDAEALNLSFEDWATELGYDPDSREAERVYNACCANARKLIKAGVDIAAERERLQDY